MLGIIGEHTPGRLIGVVVVDMPYSRFSEVVPARPDKLADELFVRIHHTFYPNRIHGVALGNDKEVRSKYPLVLRNSVSEVVISQHVKIPRLRSDLFAPKIGPLRRQIGVAVYGIVKFPVIPEGAECVGQRSCVIVESYGVGDHLSDGVAVVLASPLENFVAGRPHNHRRVIAVA